MLPVVISIFLIHYSAQVITASLMQEVVQELPVLITENDLHVSQVCSTCVCVRVACVQYVM